jgi:hypothetical protein
MRWAPGAARFIADEIAALEARGLPHTVYEWGPAKSTVQPATSFNMRLGPSPGNLSAPMDNPYLDAVKRDWAKNRLRPSGVRFPDTRG